MRLRNLCCAILTALAWLLISAGVAHAHGGMAGPDEMGPPLGISVALGLACYYVITLWPSRERADGAKHGKAVRRGAR
ncbi:MAG TPA: hypothetical protein VFB15_13665 [Candidatus Binataceae bacterium]|jgi:hypothetical protein|nr:hypothetical protein [Candidatus Binataceae bacterium]